MKILLNFLICFTAIICSYEAEAVIPNWAWAHNFNGSISSIEYHNNYIYTAGTFSDSAFIFGNANIPNNGGQDVLIAKWDTLGNLIWATSIYGTNNESSVGLKINGNSELVVAVNSNSTIVNAGGNVLNNNGSYDIFICKYNLSGVNQSNFVIGTAGNEQATDLCIDHFNNIYIASGGVVKYSNAGTYLLQLPIGGKRIYYSSFDSTIVTSGSFGGTLTYGNYTITAAGGNNDIYIAKTSMVGGALWVVNATASPSGFTDVCETYIDASNGNIYASTGSFFNGVAEWVIYLRRYAPSGTAQGVVSSMGNTDMSGPWSISGKDSLVSVFYSINSYNGIAIFNTNTNQSVKEYEVAGINNNILIPKFHLFRGINSIYTLGYENNIFRKFGKIGYQSLNSGVSNQTIPVCSGNAVPLSGNIYGGVPPLVYSWLPVTGLNNTNTNNVSFTATNNISYTLTVSDAIGQVKKDTFNILVENIIPAANITSQYPVLCDSMKLYSNNGVAGAWYQLTGNQWQFIANDTVISVYGAGKYRYAKSNACNAVADTIDVAGAFVVTASGSSDTVCAGQSVTLTGAGALNYSWTGGVSNNIPFIPISTQTYTLTGVDLNGCYDTAAITLVVEEIPLIANIMATPAQICGQGNAVLSIDSPAAYCIPIIQIPTIFEAAIVSFNFNNAIINNSQQYTDLYTYYNLTANVTAGNVYPFSITRNNLGDHGKVKNIWIDYNQDGDFDDVSEMAFSVESHSLTVNGTVTIPSNALNGKTRMRVACKREGVNTPCYNDLHGEYEDYNIMISGGADKLSWSPNAFMPNNIGNNINLININATTTYTVTAIDLNGCSASASITVNVYPNTASTTNTSICLSQTPYLWNGLSIDSPGAYNVTLVNANGCDSIATLILNISLCGQCQPNFTVNWSPFIDSLVESQTWINTSGTVLIPLGAAVKFDANAGGYVTLNPGFKAEYGSVFVAQAYNGCTAGAPQRPLEEIGNGAPFVKNEIVLYPNPTSGLIHIQHDEKLTGIQIFDMVGKLLINQKCNGETDTDIDLGNLPNGVYHVKAVGYNSIKVIKNN